MPRLITPRILHDQPLDPQRVADRAEFHFDAYANTFARLIADPATLTPLVLGVSGRWGTGKTTLLRQIEAKLQETRLRRQARTEPAVYSFMGEDAEGDFRRCRTVWFNAWKYADEDELLAALVRVVVQAMSRDGVVAQLLSRVLDPAYPRRDVVATVLSWFALRTPAGDVTLSTGQPEDTPFAERMALLDLFNDTFDRLMAAWVHGTLSVEKIDPREGALAVFVDDLDRCLPDKVVQVLEAIKLFLDRPGVVFVVAADEDAVRAAVQAHYRSRQISGQAASDYLDKILQIRFTLPPLAGPQVADYVSQRLGGLDDQLRPCLEVIIAGAETNPRQIKTFLNFLNLGWAILRNSGQAEGVEQADFIRWLALTGVSPAFCDKVRELPRDLRLDFIRDAARWANDPTYKAGEYAPWQGGDHRRLRRVLSQMSFSSRVTPEVLEGFIFWSAPPTASLAAGRPASPGGLEVRGLGEVGGAADLDPSAPGYWVAVPAGKFVMGSRDEDDMATDDERPQHAVTLPSYRIARYPVSNRQYAGFAQATGGGAGAAEARLADHPAVDVSWHDAQAYCRWLTGQLRAAGTISSAEVVRLPTEAEWEKAARGEYGREWPWGDSWDPARCNNRETGPQGTTPVGHYSPGGDSPYAVADMAGNVGEWCQSQYRPYPYQAADGREELEGSVMRLVRGGSWILDRRRCRAAYRDWAVPMHTSNHLGFRVVLATVAPSQI